MTISDVLIPLLRARFTDRGLRCGLVPEPIAIFPARCEEVGDLQILDDGDEVTICVGELTHGHFNPYDDATSSDEAVHWIVKEVMEFLEELFANRVVLWGVEGGRMGGWQMSFNGEIPRDIPSDARVFVWDRRLR